MITKAYLLNAPYLPNFTRDMRWQDTGRAGVFYYPVWLAYATGILEDAGHEARLIDSSPRKWQMPDVLEDIGRFGPDLLVLDSSFPSLSNDLGVARDIKEAHPETNIVLVGAPASQFTGEILAGGDIDFVARWEFDLTVNELAQALETGADPRTVRGISFRENGSCVHNEDRPFTTGEDLDAMPFVSRVYRDHLNPRDYFLNYSLYPQVQVFGGRGCPFQCTFCSWTQTLMGRKYRMRSPSSVVGEMLWVQDNMPGVREVFFEDDTFTIDKQWVLAFTEEYGRQGVRIPWGVQARADFDYETMAAMRRANCLVAVVGFESGSDEVLKTVKKGITVDRIRRFAADARRAGLPIHGNWIIGLPGETRETIEMTQRLIRETDADAITVAVTTPFPGTELYEWATSQGYLATSDPNEYLDSQGHQKSVMAYPNLSSGEVAAIVDRTLRGYFLTPRYIPIAFRRVLRPHGWGEFLSMWRSARSFLKYIIGRKRGGGRG